MVRYLFEWDPSKALANQKKHGVTFERAASVFSDPNALSRYDDSHSQDEERWVTLGLDRSALLLVVSHTYQEVGQADLKIRIISARKATKTEIKQYQENSI